LKMRMNEHDQLVAADAFLAVGDGAGDIGQ
jgi:hypothetical protein